MVNAPKRNLSPLLVGKYGKSTKHFTQWRHQANKDKSGLEAERDRALGALCSLLSKKKLAADKRQETHFLNNKEKEKWIEDYVERETAVARKRVQDAQSAMMQEQECVGNVDNGWLTITQPEITLEEMLNAIGVSLSDLASSKDEEDAEDEDHNEDAHDNEDEDDNEKDTGLGKRSDDNEPGWVMSTMSKTVQHCMVSFGQKQMRLDELTQPGWWDAADYFRERIMKYGMTELKVPAVWLLLTVMTAATPSPTSFGVLMGAFDIVPGQSQMPQVRSRHESSQMRLGSEKPQAENHLVPPMPAAVPDSSDRDCEASYTIKLLSPHIVSLAEYHIDIRFRRSHCDSSCVTGRVDRQRCIFDNVFRIKALCEPVLLRVRIFWISETRLWDKIIPQCVCKGCTGHANVADHKWSWLTKSELYMVLPVTDKW